MKKQILVAIIKLALLYLALPLLLLDLILIQTAVPRLIFETQPFLYSTLFVLVIAVAISGMIKSKTPILWALFLLLYSAVFFAQQMHADVFGVRFSVVTLLIAFTFLAGTINFLFRNRITEPLLVLLPVCAGAWLYLSFIYQPSLVAWATVSAGKNDVASALLSVFGDSSTNLVMMAIVVVPSAVLYFLGKHGYVRLYNYALARMHGNSQA
ncbi:MAG: hypothetical protein Q7U91_11320 [Sideroxyarcus sp.]|nr:hypothetical protein [Sideroxyarcus sp.]